MKLKKGAKSILIVLAVIVAIAIAVSLFTFFNGSSKNTGKVQQVKIEGEIKEYGYTLSENKNKDYKKLFHDLKDTLSKDEIDEKKYVTEVAQLFLMDFYTLEDKVAKTDIGGMQFVHESAKSDFGEKATDTLYRYVESNIYGDRKQELPRVKSVTIESVEQENFEYDKKSDKNAYKVKASWTYVKDMGYETEATLIFVHDDKKLVLVEMD